MLTEQQWQTIGRLLGDGQADELGAASALVDELRAALRLLLGELGEQLGADSARYLDRIRRGELGPAAAAAGPLGSAPNEVTNLETSHAMLVALLMTHGGSHLLPLDALALDAMGHVDGSAYSVASVPVDHDYVRLAVVVRAEHAARTPQTDTEA